MITIRSFQLEAGDNVIELPPVGNGRPLTVQYQRGSITLWVLLDDTVATMERHFVVVLSGVALGESFFERNNYIGTVQECGSKPRQSAAAPGENRGIVWHVFEVPR